MALSATVKKQIQELATVTTLTQYRTRLLAIRTWVLSEKLRPHVREWLLAQDITARAGSLWQTKRS